MNGNLHRGTPGRALAVFAACLAGIVALSLHKWWKRGDFESIRFPTGLGDTLFYTPADEDFKGGRLSIRQPDGSALPLFRHNFEPVEKKDERMLKVAYLTTADIWLYADSRQSPQERQAHFFLKTGPGEYIGFTTFPRQPQPQSMPAGSAPASAEGG